MPSAMAGSTTLLVAAAGMIGLFTAIPSLDRAFSASGEDGPGSGRVTRAADGQFYLDGRIGETTIRFLIDHGAQRNVIAADDAAAAGLRDSKPATIPVLTFGPTRLEAVDFVVSPNVPVSILGQEALVRLGFGSVRGDRLSRPPA